MTAALQAPETPRSAIKCVAMLLDKNLLDGVAHTTVFEAAGNFAFHHALIVGKDIQGVTVAPQIAFWQAGTPMTGFTTLDALTAADEAVEVPPFVSAGVNQAVPLMADGEPVTLENSLVVRADAFIADVYIYAAEVELT